MDLWKRLIIARPFRPLRNSATVLGCVIHNYNSDSMSVTDEHIMRCSGLSRAASDSDRIVQQGRHSQDAYFISMGKGLPRDAFFIGTFALWQFDAHSMIVDSGIRKVRHLILCTHKLLGTYRLPSTEQAVCVALANLA